MGGEIMGSEGEMRRGSRMNKKRKGRENGRRDVRKMSDDQGK